MFTHLRKSAQSIFAKLILFILVAMFGLWGIGDVFRGMGGGPANVATVGGTPITVQQYQRYLQISRKEPMQVLRSLINDVLIEKEEKAMGIAVSDDTIATYLSNQPDFRGADGQFDKALYQQRIVATGNNEAKYIENVRREIEQKILLSPFVGNQDVPQEILLALYNAQQEQRTASVVLLSPALVAAGVPAPTEQEIKKYYDAHPKDFTVPEVRRLSFVTLPIADVEAKVDVPEEEIKHTFDERKDDFRMPERRVVEDLEFYNEQEAKDAAKQLSQGNTVAQLAASASLVNKGKVSLGSVSSQDLPQDAAEKVFALKEGGLSEPVSVKIRGTQIGTWHVYHVSKIEPSRPETLDEARPAIKRDIASREAMETAQKLMNGMEDTLAGGATLDQAADKIGQKVVTLGAVMRDGTIPGGARAVLLPPYDNFLATAFSTAEKDHSQAVQAADGSYFLVRVDGVAPEHVQPLNEVKDRVARAALEEKKHAALEKLATDMSEQLRAGKTPAGMPQPVTVAGLRRDAVAMPEGPLQGKSLPPALLSELFRIHPRQSTNAYPTDDGNFMIATLASVAPLAQKPDAEALEDLRKDLNQTLTDETLLRYLQFLRGKYTVTIDAAALGLKDNQDGE